MELKDLPKNGLIDFFTTWCSPCKQMEPIIDKLQENGIKIVRVDVDEEKEISQYFQIMSIPTFVSMKNGKEHKRQVGAVSEKKLLELLDK